MQKDLLELEKKNFVILKNELDPKVLKELDEEFEIRYAHDAVKIEGKNVITLKEAYSLKEVTEKSNISEREQKELLNHRKAYRFIKEEVAKKTIMNEEFIKDTHQLLLEDIMAGGLYRQLNVGLKGQHQPPDYVKVYDRMKKLIDELEFTFKGSTIEKGAYVLLTISKIHPFIDGNGRVGRLMLNYFLMSDDYLPISISLNEKEQYFEALDQFKLEKKMTKMVELIKNLLLKRYDEVNQKLNEI